MSDPFLSDIDFKNKMTWVYTTLKSLKAKSFNFLGYKLYGRLARIKYPDYLTGGDK